MDFLLEAGDSRTALSERDQYHAGVYLDQHVSQAVGGFGVKYRDLISRLIELALERKMEQEQISYSR